MISTSNLSLEIVSERIPESLLIALDASKFTLEKIYQIRKTTASSCKDKQIESFAKACSKKFPALDPKTGRNTIFIGMVPIILKLYEDYYLGLAELAKLRELIFSIFVAMESFLHNLDINETPDICMLLLETISNFTCCIYMFNKMEDKKQIVALYTLAYQESYHLVDQNMDIINRLILEYENAWAKLWEDCERIFSILESTIVSLCPDLKLKCLDSEQMETAAQFSLSSIPHELAIPVLCKNPNLLYVQGNHICKWVYMCILACPRLIISNGSVESALHTVLNDYPIMHIYKDESVNPFKELSNRLENVKGTSRIVKTLQEWSQFAFSTSPLSHRQRRLHLKSVLAETYYFITDQPGLLGPKFIQVIQLLSASLCELEYYLTSINPTSDSSAKSKSNKSELQFDPDISVLIFYVTKIRLHIQKYSSITQYYFYQFLTMHDSEGVAHFYKETNDVKNQKSVMKSIISTISHIPQLEYGKHNPQLNTFSIYLDILRLQINNNWKLSSYVKKTDSFVVFINNVALHALIADSTLKFIDDKFSFGSILHKTQVLTNMFRETVDNSIYAHYALAIPEVITFLKMNHIHFNNSAGVEKEYSKYFTMVHDMLTVYAQKLFDNFLEFHHSIISENLYIDNKDLSNIWCTLNLSHLDIYKKMNITSNKDIASAVYDKLNKSTTQHFIDSPSAAFYNFCWAVSRIPEIVVEDVIFNVANFLYPEIEKFLNNRFSTILRDSVNAASLPTASSSSSSTLLKKPSLVLKEVHSMFEAFSLLESYLNAKYLPLLGAALMQQYTVKIPNGQLESTTITIEYGLWYIEDLINKHLKLEGMLYSPIRKCFVVKAISSFPADDYTDTYEMQALAELVGPYGITTICDLSIKFIQTIIEDTFWLLANIVPTLIQFAPYVADPTISMDDVYKKFKSIDDVIHNLTLIGAALQLRELMLDGIRETNETFCPLFSRAIKYGLNNKTKLAQFYESFSYNPKTPPNYLLLNSLSKSPAFNDEKSDDVWTRGFLALHIFIIPYFATNENIEFIPLLGAHANNCHLLSLTFHTLVPIFYKIFEKKVPPSKKSEQLKTFYRDLGISVMRMSSGSLFSQIIKDKDSMLVFYDLFMEQSFTTKLTKKLFDVIPYSLISQCYTDIYNRIKAKSKKKRNQIST